MLIRRHCDDHQDESLSCCAQFENDLFAHAKKTEPSLLKECGWKDGGRGG
jgi:hypothetical protein